MTDDQWARLAKTDRPELEEELRRRWRATAAEDRYALLQDPVAVAVVFLKVLEAGPGQEERLRAFIAPESAEAWGDFSAARMLLERLGDWAFPTVAAAGPTPDLAYVHLLADVRDSFVSDEEQIVFSAATVTLRRREGEWWRVLAFGAPS